MAIDLVQHRKDEHQIGALQEFLKQIVFGGNDGIVTTFAIVAGFAGAGVEGAVQIGGIAVLLFGVANLLADATSMGLGEFLSSRAERDLYVSHRKQELHEIEHNADYERAEVLDILHQHNMKRDDAVIMADVLQRNPEMMADFMMNYELGMADSTGENPAVKGFFTFIAFIIFGVVPLFPYFILEPVPATFNWSIFATFLALVTLGLLRWYATTVNLWRCVIETVFVGGICAVVAFAVGLAFTI